MKSCALWLTSVILAVCVGMLSAPCFGSSPPRPAGSPPPIRSGPAKKATPYVCPMHPGVKSNLPGQCPQCGMSLRPVHPGDDSTVPSRAAAITAAGVQFPPVRMPDTEVLDQYGHKLHFYTDLVKDKTVAIDFIFTTCTTICPPLTATFRRVQQELGDRVGRDIRMISISVDPAVDVPERLKKFASTFHAGSGWTFVTGNKPEIDRLLLALGAYTGDKFDHSPMVLVGNAAGGYWTRAYGLASANEVVKIIRQAAAKGKVESTEQKKTGAVARNQAGLSAAAPAGPESALNTVRASSVTAPTLLESAAAGIVNVADSSAATRPAKGSARETRTLADAAARYFPNLVMLTQDDKPVHFYEDLLKGKTVLINFMFTTCTAICPPMTANLARVQQYLGDHVGRDVNMISISVDPANDTPAALKKFARNYKVRPGWFFLTGEKKNVDSVLHKLGGYVEDKGDHSTLVIIGNPDTGQWMKMFAMAPPSEISDAVLKTIPAAQSNGSHP